MIWTVESWRWGEALPAGVSRAIVRKNFFSQEEAELWVWSQLTAGFAVRLVMH